jgi:hypothetical protein
VEFSNSSSPLAATNVPLIVSENVFGPVRTNDVKTPVKVYSPTKTRPRARRP